MADSIGDAPKPSQRRLQLRVTVTVGSFIVVLSSVVILWVLGTFDDIGPRPLLEAERFEVTPVCSSTGKYLVSLELHSLAESFVEITYFDDKPLSEVCETFTVSSTQTLGVQRAISMGYLAGDASKDGYRQLGSNRVLTQTRIDLTPTENSPASLITVNFNELHETDNAIFLRLSLPDFSRKLDFSSGRSRASFFLYGADDDDASASFFATISQDLRHTRVRGTNVDPKIPNSFEYRPSRYEIAGVSHPIRVVLFDAEFESIRRDKLRDVLLVAFSALFGVGVSALFESLILTELLRRISEIAGKPKK